MKYSEIIDVNKHFRDAYDITADTGEAWKTFISNDKFETNLKEVLNALITPEMKDRKSIWLQGTYGTGKSHSLSVIKHLLSDPYSDIEDYLPRISSVQLRNQIRNFSQHKKVFPVVMKGVYTITDVVDLSATIQQEVSNALKSKGIEIVTKTDFQSLADILKSASDNSLDSFFEGLIRKDPILASYAQNIDGLIERLEHNDTTVLRILTEAIKKAGLNGYRISNITTWLREVKNELAKKGLADYLLIFWDEFTALLDVQERRSILDTIQNIAELSFQEELDPDTNEKNTTGIYLMIVSHKRLEATESYRELKENEKNMAQARFIQLDYSMQPTTTYHILYGALDRKNEVKLTELINKNIVAQPKVMNVIDHVIEADAVNATDIKEKVKNLYPFHPYTSYLATFVSRIVGEAERSIFGFLNDKKFGFKKYIQNDISESNFLTADYVWDFFYATFESNDGNHFEAVLNKYKLSKGTVESKGEVYLAVFKVILLLNILYRQTTTEGDNAESSRVTPSVDNILAAFSGAFPEEQIQGVLKYLDDAQILHRNPNNVFEISTTALPAKEVRDTTNSILKQSEDVGKLAEEYPTSLKKYVIKFLETNIARKLEIHTFWGGQKESYLQNSLRSAFKSPYFVSIALVLYRGDTKDLDSLVVRSETKYDDSKNMFLEISKQEEFKNTVFILVKTPFGNKRMNEYARAEAELKVAEHLSLENASDFKKPPVDWIEDWFKEISSTGVVDTVFQGSSTASAFTLVHNDLENSYIPSIFNHSFDSIHEINSNLWEQKTAKALVEKVLKASTRTDFEATITGGDRPVRNLLLNGSELLFDENLKLISSNDNIAIVNLCDQVKNKLEEKKNEPSIDLGREFKYLTEPGYGFYSSQIFMTAVALAFKPFVDRLYTANSGEKVDKMGMKDIVLALFDFWEKGKENAKLQVRMSTQEEKEFTEELTKIFSLDPQEGLVKTKWTLRNKFKTDNQAPLWVLKYVDDNGADYNHFVDQLFDYTKAINDNIDQSLVSSLLDGLKNYNIEIANGLENVKNGSGLKKYVKAQLDENHVPSDDLQIESAIEYLTKTLNDDKAFWDEQEVRENILKWRLTKTQGEADSGKEDTDKEKNSQGKDSEQTPSNTDEGQEQDSDHNTTPVTDVPDADQLRVRIRMKLRNCRSDSNKLYDLLDYLVTKHSEILKDLDDRLG